MSASPKISIVTPSFNGRIYLEETIQSVLYQDFPSFEHIVIDGGSNDGTVELLKTFPHLVWVSEQDSGQSEALNKGFSMASGEIIGWLNSDDTYNPGTFNFVAEYFNDHPEVDLVGSDINIINKDSLIIGMSRGKPFDIIELLTYNMIKQPTIFMRRKVIDQLIGVNQQLHYVMDQELWLRAGVAGFKFDYIQGTVFANFRIIEGTKTFNDGISFEKEWFGIVDKALKSSYFSFLNSKYKRNILSKRRTSIYLAEMIDNIDAKNKLLAIKLFLLILGSTPTIFFNRGIWKFLFFSLVGVSVDKVRKFRINASK